MSSRDGSTFARRFFTTETVRAPLRGERSEPHSSVRWSLALALIFFVAPLARATDEATTIDVQVDGRGSIKLDVYEDVATSDRLLLGAGTPEAQQRRGQEL